MNRITKILIVIFCVLLFGIAVKSFYFPLPLEIDQSKTFDVKEMSPSVDLLAPGNPLLEKVDQDYFENHPFAFASRFDYETRKYVFSNLYKFTLPPNYSVPNFVRNKNKIEFFDLSSENKPDACGSEYPASITFYESDYFNNLYEIGKSSQIILGDHVVYSNYPGWYFFQYEGSTIVVGDKDFPTPNDNLKSIIKTFEKVNPEYDLHEGRLLYEFENEQKSMEDIERKKRSRWLEENYPEYYEALHTQVCY